jgi:hypothetical protein
MQFRWSAFQQEKQIFEGPNSTSSIMIYTIITFYKIVDENNQLFSNIYKSCKPTQVSDVLDY